MKNWHSVALLSTLLATACSFSPTTTPDEQPGDHYSVSVSAFNEDSTVFTYTTGSGTRFILPYHFFDNPVEPTSGPLVRDLRVNDANGEAVDTLCENATIGPLNNIIVVLPEGTALPVTFSYRLNLTALHHDQVAKIMPEIHINDSSFFLIGAYCFIIPQIDPTLTGLWRAPRPVQVTLTGPSGTNIYGMPSPYFTCANLYELLFVQFGAGPAPLARGHGGGVDFAFVDYTGAPRPAGLFDSISTVFSEILDDVASNYGTFTGSPYTVSIQNFWGGLEGTFGFSVNEPDSRFGEVLAHEALHNFIGIRCGEYDDPWWKEATAAWLGLETAVRLGYCEKESLRKRMTTRFDLIDTARFRRSLSDPQLRSDLFPGMLHGLVYERGAQVMMLLDVSVRLGSGNRSNLNHATADLCRRFSGSAFGREDFLSALERFGAADARAVFAAYVDRPDSVMTEGMLTRTFDRFDSLVPY